MKKMAKIFGFLGLFLLASCASEINKSQVFTPLAVTASSALDADIEVNMQRKLKGTAYAHYLFSWIHVSGNNKYLDGVGYNGNEDWGRQGAVKAAAAYNAVKHTNADVLVSPQYVIRESGNIFWKTITVTVTGFAGRITNFKKAPVSVNRNF